MLLAPVMTNAAAYQEAIVNRSGGLFDARVSERAERLAPLKGELVENEASLKAMPEAQSDLREELENILQTIDKLNVVNAQLVTLGRFRPLWQRYRKR